jgi:hypothetical protein
MNILPCIEHQTGNTLKAICSDNALEFCSGIFPAKLKQLGISQEFTLHYEHEQAGIAENTNRTIMDKARTMLHASAMNESFWPDAFHTAILLQTTHGIMAWVASHMKNSQAAFIPPSK